MLTKAHSPRPKTAPVLGTTSPQPPSLCLRCSGNLRHLSYRIASYCTALYIVRTVLYCTIPYRIVPFLLPSLHTIQYCRTVSHRIVPYCIVPHGTVSYRTVPYLTSPHSNSPCTCLCYPSRQLSNRPQVGQPHYSQRGFPRRMPCHTRLPCLRGPAELESTHTQRDLPAHARGMGQGGQGLLGDED